MPVSGQRSSSEGNAADLKHVWVGDVKRSSLESDRGVDRKDPFVECPVHVVDPFAEDFAAMRIAAFCAGSDN